MSYRARTALSLHSVPTESVRQSWIHLLPAGVFTGRDGRGPFRVSNAAAVLQASRKYAGARMIPVDYEHQIDLAPKNGQPAPAAGWIDALEARRDGIWGRVTWTERASEYLERKEYRYLSPVMLCASDGTVKSILRAALTNHPNLDQLTALSRSEMPMDSKETLHARLREMLQLPDESTDNEIARAVEDLLTARHSSAPDPSLFVPIGAFETAVSEVNRLNQGVSHRDAHDHVSLQVRNGNLPPILKEWGIALCGVNKVAFDAFVERTRGAFNSIIDPKAKETSTSRHVSSRLGDDELEICARMGVSEDELLKARAFNTSGRD